MNGRIVLVNAPLGWFAVEQGNGDVTVVDSLGSHMPHLDDIVEGDLHSTTRETLSNRATGDMLLVRMVGTVNGRAHAAALMQRGRVGLAGAPVRSLRFDTRYAPRGPSAR